MDMDPQATIRSTRSSRRASGIVLDDRSRRLSKAASQTRIKAAFFEGETSGEGGVNAYIGSGSGSPYGQRRRIHSQQSTSFDDWQQQQQGHRNPSPSSSSCISYSGSSPTQSPRMRMRSVGGDESLRSAAAAGSVGHRRSRPRLADMAQLHPSSKMQNLHQQDDANNRWSVWTADTTAHSSDSSFEGDSGPKSLPPPYDQPTSSSSCSDDGVDRRRGSEGLEDEDEDSRPPSPTTEAALDAALSTTMLALTTANSLLLSTMASRADLARLRAAQVSLDAQLDAREAELQRDVELHAMKLRWLETANERLEAVLSKPRSPGSLSLPLPQVQTKPAWQQQQHWRKPSVGQVHHEQQEAPATTTTTATISSDVSTWGIVEAKDDNATIGKSAAKRLERMLRQSTSTSGAEESEAHSRNVSSSSTVSSAVIHEDDEEGEEAETVSKPTPTKKKRQQQQPLPLSSQLASPAISSSMMDNLTMTPTKRSSMASTSSVISSSSGSRRSSAASSPVRSRPPSMSSSGASNPSRAKGALSALLTASTPSAIVTTPPTPVKDLPGSNGKDETVEEAATTPVNQQRWSQATVASTEGRSRSVSCASNSSIGDSSSIHSRAGTSTTEQYREHPSPGLAYCHRRQRGASGSYLTSDAAALGLFSSHDDGDEEENAAIRSKLDVAKKSAALQGRKGALGALQRLNEQDKLEAAAPSSSSFLQSLLSPSTIAAAPSSATASVSTTTGPASSPLMKAKNLANTPSTTPAAATAAADTPGQGWGGTLASWVRLSSNNSNTNTSTIPPTLIDGLPAPS